MAKSALIADLEKQFAENPRRVFARLANEYRKAGELETAIEICRAHVPLQPTYISGYIVLGQALFESGQLDEARTTFETALGLDPENLIALRQLGDIARAGGDANGARGWYRRLLEVDPQNDEIGALVDELSAVQEGPSAAPSEVPPISWGDINPEQPPVEAPPPAAVPVAAVEPPAPAPAPVAAQEKASPEAVFEPLDLSDLRFGAEPPPPPPDAEPAGRVGAGDMAGFDFESLSSFGMETFSAGHADVQGIERADELFSPDADNAGQPIPGLELEGLERGGYYAGGQQASGTPEPGVLGHPEPTSMFDAADELFAGVPAEDLAPSSGAVESAPEPTVAGGAGQQTAPGDTGAEPPPPAFVTETMAELYLRQGHREAALDIYRQLAAQRPDDAALLQRIAQLEHPEGQGTAQRTVRAFFARLALKHPPYTGAASAAPAPVVELPAPLAVPHPEPEASEAPPMDLATALGLTEAPEPAAEIHAGEPVAPLAPVEAVESVEPPAATASREQEAADLQPAEVELAGPISGEPEAPAAEPTAEERPVAELLFGEMEPPPLPETPPAAALEPRELPPLAVASLEPQLPPPLPMPAAEEPVGGEAPAGEPVPAAERAPMPVPELGVEELLAAEPSPDDELAAASLAGAFAPEMGPPARPGPAAGQPARAAADPLSLDTVFREGRGLEGQPQSNVSFDEFFAGEEGATPASGAPGDAHAGSDAGGDRDLELFQAWLEGLKK